MLRLSALLLVGSLLTVGCDTPGGALLDSSIEDNGVDDQAEAEDPPFTPTLLLHCEAAVPCDALPVAESPSADAEFSYDETARCVLGALAAGDAGLLQTVTDFDRSSSNVDLLLLGDGRVLRQAYGAGDGVGEWANPPSLCTLAPAEQFVKCLADYDSSCLDTTSWLVGCEPLEALECPLAPE
ncbi:MAG: hypothetical protein R3A51_10800 [Nannocystaceae bacterium]